MAIRIALFLLLGLGFASLGAVVMIGFAPSHPAPAQTAEAPPAPTVPILVAARPLNGGTLLVPEDVTSKDVAPGDVPDGAWTDSLDTRAAVRGAMIRHGIDKGVPIGKSDVVRPGDRGFLAAVLAPGARAATIAVDAVTGTAGLIWPGDHVDVILTQKLDEPRQAARRVSGETVLQNARVIAVDQHLAEGEAPSGGLGNASIGQRTVTLEVGHPDAERLSVAATMGRLTLVVRSASDRAETDADVVADIVWGGDVSAAYRSDSGNGASTTVHLFAGSQASPVEFHY